VIDMTMRLTVLGSGTCVPSGERSSAGYWLDAGARRVRLDCGAGTVHAMARYGLAWETLTHQFVSHFHVDHVGELMALLFAFKYGRSAPRAEPLSIVGPAGLEALATRLAGDLWASLLEQEFPLEFVEVAAGDALDLGGATLRVAKTRHTAESLAVRVEAGGRSVGYTGDAAPSDDLADLFRGVDLLVCECSFVDDARGTKHMIADEVAALAREAGAKHLVATHFYFDPEAERLADRLARGFAGRVTIARDGLVVDV
jgi:ribonuclease BN (tRNA processing enzyme)